MDALQSRHHNAPPLADRLAVDHASLAARAQEAADLCPLELQPIPDDQTAGEYAETAKAIKGVTAQIETARKGEKDEVLKTGRTIDAFFAKLAEPLKQRADKLVGEINVYQRAKLEAERKAQAEADEARRREAAAFDEAPPVAAPVVVKEAARVTSFSGVTASASPKWVHEVTNPDEVPRQYLMVNEAAIKAAVAGGQRTIPGVRIYEDVRTAIR